MSAAVRSDYRDWLRRNGDVDRAELLSGLSRAFESLNAADLPDMGSVPAAWARLTGASSLKRLLEDGEYAPVRLRTHAELTASASRLFSLARPALDMAFEPSDEVSGIGRSRLWGEPDLPPDMPWPTLGECLQPWEVELDPASPCSFLGQLNMTDMAGTVASLDLPPAGLLSVFCHVDGYGGGFSVFVAFTADLSSVSRRAPPSTRDEYNLGSPPHRIEFGEALAFPDHDGPWRTDLLVREYDAGVDEGSYYCLVEGGGASSIGLLGYFSGTSGGDLTPDRSARRLGSFRVTPDAGIVHLGIPEASLRAGDFTAFDCPWYDWDL